MAIVLYFTISFNDEDVLSVTNRIPLFLIGNFLCNNYILNNFNISTFSKILLYKTIATRAGPSERSYYSI